MVPPTDPARDRRGSLLRVDEIPKWLELPSGFKAGLLYGGEFRMCADFGHVIIADESGREWINFGFYKFYFPNWNAGGVKLEAWNNPLACSPDGNYIALNWLYAHQHSTISPVLIHLPTRTYQIVEPRRIVTALAVSNAAVLSCAEIVWENSERRDRSVEIASTNDLRPIEEFFETDPFEIETDVYSWKEGVLHIEPVQNFRGAAPSNEKEREELKRARAYHPVDRWRHIKEITDWVKNGFRS